MKEIAIVFAGTKFDANRHVKQLYLQLQRYGNIEFRLTCFTDNAQEINALGLPIRTIDLPNWKLSGMRSLWWYKIAVFDPTISWRSSILYMDLDVIVCGDLGKFFNYENKKFCILQDFNRKFIPDYPVLNSSLIRFEPGKTGELFEYFLENKEIIMRKFRGDQDYLTDYFKEHAYVKWPKQWAMSYKWEILHGGATYGGPDIKPEQYHNLDTPYILPDDCSIVVFHGKPDPSETFIGEKFFING